MTREEIEKAFPIGSRVIHKENGYHLELNGCFVEVVGHVFDADGWYLVLKWEEFSLAAKYATRGWSPWHFQVSGPAVQEPEHDGMIYNPITKQWSWF